MHAGNPTSSYVSRLHALRCRNRVTEVACLLSHTELFLSDYGGRYWTLHGSNPPVLGYRLIQLYHKCNGSCKMVSILVLTNCRRREVPWRRWERQGREFGNLVANLQFAMPNLSPFMNASIQRREPTLRRPLQGAEHIQLLLRMCKSSLGLGS